ncbi:unnamed protein product [Orchesella dallaii]|uniref:E3 ubiquitin-protein ligase Sina-like RING finger domain-containing protein n=1 Tax=Orchesella dallaii TaxID=48710 RepID=A0ABP1QBV3_9HEXA
MKTATIKPFSKTSAKSLRRMKCLSCKIVVFPPVLQCKYKHSVCNFCRKKLDTCPDSDCKENIESATRSAVAEKFLEKHVLRCTYFREGTGCMEATLNEEADLMQAHETICHFREVKCLVPGCYKHVRFMELSEHFDMVHTLPRHPCENIVFNTSQMIMKKEILNETCGERSHKTAVAYAVHEDCIFLVIFRMNSLRLPVFEISSIVHPYYTEPVHMEYRCKIIAKNEEDSFAHYEWSGPVNQTFPLTPLLSVRDELAKLKWIVTVNVFPCVDY